MTDFGLGENIVSDETLLRRALKWHGLIPRNGRIGSPDIMNLAKTKNGMGSDSDVNPLNPVSKDTNRNA